MEELQSQSLNISVWHNETFGRNLFLGEVDLDLSSWDFNNTHINEYTLKAKVMVCFFVHGRSDLIGWFLIYT